MTEDFTDLIPELPTWNDGAGIDAKSWIGCLGNYELASGYSLVFWPKFVRSGDYVLLDGFSEESLRGFEEMTDNSRVAVETVMNHLHISDIHFGAEKTEAQVRYLGRVLKEIYEVKLRNDFSDVKFEVSFNDEAGLIIDEYELTFWQTAD